jgi:hypothetical protein
MNPVRYLKLFEPINTGFGLVSTPEPTAPPHFRKDPIFPSTPGISTFRAMHHPAGKAFHQEKACCLTRNLSFKINYHC